jgi:hypothetical protein
MSRPVIIEELQYDPEFERAFAKTERNRVWFIDTRRSSARSRDIEAAMLRLRAANCLSPIPPKSSTV